MSALVVFDLETGGLDLTHPIIQLAAVAIDTAAGEELGAFERLVQFNEADADPEALKINHYDRGRWALEAVHESVVVCDFRDFLENYRSLQMVSKRTGRPYSVAQLVAHNAEFDSFRLKRLYETHGAFLPAHPHVLCTRQMISWRRQFRGQDMTASTKLVDVCAELGVEIEKAHSALADARAAARVILAMQPRRAA